MNTTAKYFGCLLFTGVAIAAFPMTMRGNDNAIRTTDNSTIGSRNVSVDNDRIATGSNRETRIYKVTGYCSCEKCCGHFAGVSVDSGQRLTASGYRLKPADYGRICAAPRNIPFGTKLDIDGIGVVDVQDRGGSIREAGDTVAGKVLTYPRLDILMKDHETAKRYGVQYHKVTIQN